MAVKSIGLSINSHSKKLLNLFEDFDLSYGIVFYNPSEQIPSFIHQEMCETLNGKSLWFQPYSLNSLDLSQILKHFKLAFIPTSENHVTELLNTDLGNTFSELLILAASNNQNSLTLIVFE